MSILIRFFKFHLCGSLSYKKAINNGYHIYKVKLEETMIFLLTQIEDN